MRRTPARYRITSILMILFGVAALVAGENIRRQGVTPKNQLTYVMGQATNVSFSRVYGRWGQTTDYLHFAVYGHNTDYGSNMRGYPQVVNAVRSGQVVTLGFPPNKQTVFSTPNYVRLYALWLGRQPLVTYEETAAVEEKSNQSILIVGGMFSIGGLISLIYYRAR